MTIKQQGGIFGRNPTFNVATASEFVGPISGLATSAEALKSSATTGLMQVTGPATGQTRTMTIPDANFTAARTDAGQTFSGVQTFSGSLPAVFSRTSAGNLSVYWSTTGLDWVVSAHSDGYWRVQLDGVGDALRIDGATRDVSVSAGNLVMSNGKGIDFSATSGTGTSELFDDYEEGTFTPYFESSGATFNNNTFSGTYTKVGRLVHIYMYCNFPTGVSGVSGTLTNTLFIKGLPFTPTAEGSGNVKPYKVDYPTGDWLYPSIRTDGSIRLYMIRDNNYFVDWTAAAFDVVAAGAAMSFGLVGTYTAD